MDKRSLEKEVKVHELLENPDNWTQHAFGRDADGNNIDPRKPEACKWDIVGAVNRCYHDEEIDEILARLYAELDSRGIYDLLTVYNDKFGVTHKELLGLFQKLDI